jgi:hypothetical protein
MSARNNGFQNMREVDEQSQKAPATSQPSECVESTVGLEAICDQTIAGYIAHFLGGSQICIFRFGGYLMEFLFDGASL